MKEAFIVGGRRSAIGSFGGSLSAVRADDLAAQVIADLVALYPSLDTGEIADVIFGCANQAGEDNRNIARMAALLAGLPPQVPGETVNRLCASGMSAGAQAMRAIRNGDGELFVAGGVEQMTRAPYVMSKPSRAFGTDAKMYDSSFGWRFVNPKMFAQYGTDAMGETAENLVDQYQISREDQDRFALWSQQKAAAAQASGRLAQEISALRIPRRKQEDLVFEQDEFVKPQSSMAGLSKLRPAFKADGGSVTAGNSSGLNDGAAALLIASEQGLKDHQLEPQARMVSMGVAGVEPRVMGIGPVYASAIALKKAGLSLDDMDIIELNEAFAAQALACTRKMGLADDDPRINPNGGAIALGHPLGMSGARLLQTAAMELQATGKRYALCTMCIGVGQGYAVILERA